MLLSYVRKDSFTKAWTREFSLLSCSLMANVFCKEIWKELGQGYTKIIFIKKGNQISCIVHKIQIKWRKILRQVNDEAF